MLKLQIAEKINLAISIFTALAAMSSAVAAFYSYEQLQIARKSSIKNEQINAFDEFAKSANYLCISLSDPELDRVWDTDKNDFNQDFDLNQYEGKRPPKMSLTLQPLSNDQVSRTNNLNQLRFEGAKLIALEGPEFSAAFVDAFLSEMAAIVQPLKPEEHGDWANQLRYMQRESRSQKKKCLHSLNDMMLTFGHIMQR